MRHTSRWFLCSLFCIPLCLFAGEPEKAPPKADAAQLKALLDTLGSDNFEKREKATEELMKLGPAAIDAVIQREKETDDAEIKARCGKLRVAIGDPNATALAVLEKIAKSDALFLRPGSSRVSLTKHIFNGPDFAKHLRTKAAVQNVSLTCPAGEFVEKVASESVLKAGPYTVKLMDGTDKELKVWLAETLKLKFDEKK